MEGDEKAQEERKLSWRQLPGPFKTRRKSLHTGSDAYVDLSKLTRDQAAAIQEITSEVFVSGTTKNEDGDQVPVEVKRTKFKLADKRGALELLGKHLKLWTEKVEQAGPNGKPLDTVKVLLIGSKEGLVHS